MTGKVDPPAKDWTKYSIALFQLPKCFEFFFFFTDVAYQLCSTHCPIEFLQIIFKDISFERIDLGE